jgi:dipeptidyl-peptidase 4
MLLKPKNFSLLVYGISAMNVRALSLACVLGLCFLSTLPRVEPAQQPSLATVAEKSNFTATSKHSDVVDFCEKLAKQSPLVRLAEMGVTNEGRKLPLIIIADPPVATPEEAAKSGKLVVFAMGNIHAGEVDGKEGLLMLARDLATAKNHPLLKDLIIVILPNFNADGGDRFGNWRKTQAGPPEVGIRHNAQDFDLNRDMVKLESPECRALARFCTQWDPAMVIDCHTTDGSYHQYTLTYDSPRHPSNVPLRDFARDVLLPDVGKRLEKATGYKAFYYNGGGADKGKWNTTPAQPRYGFHYQGFRNRLGILSESYDYAPYRDRVLASRGFVLACFEFAAENKDKIRKLMADGDKANTDAPAGATVALRHKMTPLGEKQKALILQGGKTIEGGAKPKDVIVDVMFQTEATLSVPRPYAYLFPASLTNVVENLQRHGIDVEELREDINLDVEAYKIDEVTFTKKIQQGYGKHNLVTVEATSRKENRKEPAGTIVVRTNQKLGTLAAFLLEPQSEDGLAAWNFFDASLKQGQDYPVVRVVSKVPMTLGKVRPLADERGPKKLLSPAMLDDGTLPDFLGNPVTVEWLDGDHFLQVKDGELLKVHAVTGRSVPFQAHSLYPASVIGQELPGGVRHSPFSDADAVGPFVPQGKKKGGADLSSTSPNGKHNAFVRNNNMYVQDVETKQECALTKDGSDTILNGKLDWVYYEEVYDRKVGYKGYWWSPDGAFIAFQRTDDAPVPKATVVDYSKPHLVLEVTAYPHVGDPNPKVKLGIAPSATGDVRWVDLSDYANDESFILARVGWMPDSKLVYLCVQDRFQTWLDFCTVGVDGGKPTKLLRDSTKAWVEPPFTPIFLKDGSFLLSSEHTGWKHIYHHAKDGKLIGPVTSGDWDVRAVQRLNEEDGYLYFTGTKENLVSTNAYRVKLDGTDLERVTKGKGTHDVSFSPRGDMFVTTYSDEDTPPRVSLHRADGTPLRMLDTNPVYVREEYQMGTFQHVKIPTPDGFQMEATVQKPAKFDPDKKYPVWVMTYGGPAMPMIKGGAGGGKDQALANSGYIIMHVDPRSASGKGAVSAWTCYKQLGVQELADLETAVKWITANPWADPERVGISGHSYGGFMTAYALTHSKLFAAGIAGAPPTDWRNYDTIYTERYMLTPKENPEGYEVTSVVKGAKDIHGRLLLLHGLKDDNVHVQNSIELIHALQQSNKDFDLMLYPLSRHGIGGAHYQRLQREFMQRHLKPEQ